jgi:hypothetical protein
MDRKYGASYSYVARFDRAYPFLPSSSILVAVTFSLAALRGYSGKIAGLESVGGPLDLVAGLAAGPLKSLASLKFAMPKASAPSIVARVAQAEADKGANYLKQFLKEGQWNAYIKDPAAGSRFLGTAVHKATAAMLEKIFPGRFRYNNIGPDFFDTLTGKFIELTTPGQIARHIAKGGLYDLSEYAKYILP